MIWADYCCWFKNVEFCDFSSFIKSLELCFWKSEFDFQTFSYKNGDLYQFRYNHFEEKIFTKNILGFANLPNQLYRKSVKDGFEFSLMVVGESGLGKSTLINSLFLTDIYSQVKIRLLMQILKQKLITPKVPNKAEILKV